ncbi:transglycosylase family protein [Streptomyces globisporus]|uniref:transglycosylase family protein n=1 Tax=Streptomyces globisporus TaxID=1908 RepID=UPI002D21D5A9|nr:transglycosylase family protein [Streptomyces globisporus]
MALPLLATGSASAADAATWDRVAECESGGQWSANFGNGMYGGLQFTQDSWERNGGLAYAPSPDLASRAQQIAVAEKALAKGSTEWATCAPIAGLTNDGKATGVNPGPTVVPTAPTGPLPESDRTAGAPTASSGTAGTKGRSTASATPSAPTTPTAPVTSATPTAPATSTTPATPTTPGTPEVSVTPGTPDSSDTPGTDAPSATPGTGKHRGEAAPEESGKADSSPESGRHASSTDKPGEKVDTTPATDEAKDSGATDSQDTPDEYTVRPGDSLSGIAQENELPGGWTALYDANRQTVGTDPNLILPGQSLDLTVGSTTVAG